MAIISSARRQRLGYFCTGRFSPIGRQPRDLKKNVLISAKTNFTVKLISWDHCNMIGWPLRQNIIQYYSAWGEPACRLVHPVHSLQPKMVCGVRWSARLIYLRCVKMRAHAIAHLSLTGLHGQLKMVTSIKLSLTLIWQGEMKVKITSLVLWLSSRPLSGKALNWACTSKYVWRAFDCVPVVNDVNGKSLSTVPVYKQ